MSSLNLLKCDLCGELVDRVEADTKWFEVFQYKLLRNVPQPCLMDFCDDCMKEIINKKAKVKAE